MKRKEALMGKRHAIDEPPSWTAFR